MLSTIAKAFKNPTDFPNVKREVSYLMPYVLPSISQPTNFIDIATQTTYMSHKRHCLFRLTLCVCVVQATNHGYIFKGIGKNGMHQRVGDMI